MEVTGNLGENIAIHATGFSGTETLIPAFDTNIPGVTQINATSGQVEGQPARAIWAVQLLYTVGADATITSGFFLLVLQTCGDWYKVADRCSLPSWK